jgi:hypothetical protein
MTATTGTTRPARTPRTRAAAPGVEAIDAAIGLVCRTLQLPTIRGRYDEIAATALREHTSYKHFLADLLGAEVAERAQRRKLRLVHEASFARPKRLEDFSGRSRWPARRLVEPADPGREWLVWCGVEDLPGPVQQPGALPPVVGGLPACLHGKQQRLQLRLVREAAGQHELAAAGQLCRLGRPGEVVGEVAHAGMDMGGRYPRLSLLPAWGWQRHGR